MCEEIQANIHKGAGHMQLTLQEAAHLSQKSTRQLLRWIDTKKLTAAKDDTNHWMIELADLQEVSNLDPQKTNDLLANKGITLVGLLARVERLEKSAGLH
jgi:hypothetical protein